MGYSKFMDLEPIELFREDLIALEERFGQLVQCTRCNFVIHAKAAGHDISAEPFHSLESLVEARFPGRIDELDFTTRQVVPNQSTDRSVRIEIDKESGDLRVFSENDEEWVRETTRQLMEFLRERRPWFAGFKRILGPAFNASMLLSLLLTLPVLISGNRWLFVFSGVLFLYSLAMLVLGQKQVVFPFSRICLYPATEDRRRNYESLCLAGWVAIIAFAVAGALYFM